MIIEPRLKKFESGARLTLGSLNSIIKRIEYAGNLIRQYSPIAGKNIFVEQQKNGKTISYLQPVGGGIRPLPPEEKQYPFPLDPKPEDLELPWGDGQPIFYPCSGGISSWALSEVGPPSQVIKGYVVSDGVWQLSCLDIPKVPFCSYSVVFDDSGNIGPDSYPPDATLPTRIGSFVPKLSRYGNKYFYLWASYTVIDAFGVQTGIGGNGSFGLQ